MGSVVTTLGVAKLASETDADPCSLCSPYTPYGVTLSHLVQVDALAADAGSMTTCDYCPSPATTERKAGMIVELLCAEHAQAYDQRVAEERQAAIAAVIRRSPLG